jgi:hypothetical protein
MKCCLGSLLFTHSADFSATTVSFSGSLSRKRRYAQTDSRLTWFVSNLQTSLFLPIQVSTGNCYRFFTAWGFSSRSILPLRNTAETLRLIGAEVGHQTIYNWIRKYTALMEKYLDGITPQVRDTWRGDELFLKVKGNMKCLYALMDDQTRFRIAEEVADTKYTADIRPRFP